eukprot:5956642-Pyramimonas_sp.AAC.1
MGGPHPEDNQLGRGRGRCPRRFVRCRLGRGQGAHVEGGVQQAAAASGVPPGDKDPDVSQSARVEAC